MKRVLSLVLLAFALTSCAAITDSMKKWEGRHVSGLLAAWGQPHQIYADGRGGTVIVYLKERGFYYPATSQTYTDFRGGVYNGQISGAATTYTIYNPAYVASYTAHRTFFVNKDGTVTGWE